ncbi:type II CRISPR RNA-guided endonuclease Cas9 [Mycoplasma sp. 'Moose RK']|uniref:type II CRISPR RNA-guided endonuclease Cas9 n=1 Tax=Mycoplasma sp. 'Moose RK' TaxID=2780095 RepID=UPI0018C22C3A|nr:type II CRISPR RNA-guided endonuclease Cas9 [Mycoplasma sp. 'Moose RK']MBG0730788.1 type II CRISPR RNA-guided endonuclease Cas9 [Mycoplasma sp. 'Moose RK']
MNWGSRLFSEREKAAGRRDNRKRRRNIRRRQYKNEKFLKLILKSKSIFDFKNIDEIKNSFIKSSNENTNILNLKIRALTEKIDPKDLAWILHDYLENRGYFYELDEEEEGKKHKKHTGDKFPTEVLNEFFRKNNFFKSSKINFSNQQWTDEIKKVFEVQKIDDEFQESFLRLFNFIRDFAKGPGSEHSASEYGIWKFDKKQNKIVQQFENIWDKTVGKCSFFPNELRSSLNFVSYEFFNLLNELSNLRSECDVDWKLKKEDRDNLLNELLSKRKNIDVKKIKKIIIKDLGLDGNEEINDGHFRGNELLKNENDIETKLKDKTKTTNILLEEIAKHAEKSKDWISVDNFVDHLEKLDSICSVLEKYKEKRDRFIEELNKTGALGHFEIKNKDEFINALLKNKKLSFKKIGSLSEKTTRLFVAKMLETNKNSESIKWEDEEIREIVQKSNENKKPPTKYLNPFVLKDEVLPPAVKQTSEQAISVLNRIIKKYSKNYEISGIYIEIPRDKNDKKAKKAKKQKTNFSKGLDQVYETIKYDLESRGISRRDLDNKPARLLQKLKLYYQQDGIDLYSLEKNSLEKNSLEKIDLVDLINNSEQYEVDHIIPWSDSLDNSLSNLVLTTRKENNAKSDLCAAAYMKTKGEQIYKNYRATINKLFNPKNRQKDSDNYPFALDNKAMLKKLKFLYLEKIDPHQREDFLSRQLNDTRYSTVLFRDAVIEHFKDNPNFAYEQKIKVFTLNGHHTAAIRKQIFPKKDREDNSHHAMDAAIIAIMANENRHALTKLLTLQDNVLFSKYELGEDGAKINKETGEITKHSEYESKKLKLIKQISGLVKEKIENAQDKVKIKFSRKIKNSTNGSLFGETLYGLRQDDDGKFDKIEKINLVNPKNLKNLQECFADPEKNGVLMYKSHKSEFEKLRKIFNQFNENKKNNHPFHNYMDWLVEKEYVDPEEKANALGAKKLIYFDPSTERKTLFKDLRLVTEKNVNKNFVFVNKKQGEKSFQTGKNQLFALVYKNKKGEFNSIPVNFLTKKFGTELDRDFYSLDESKYNQENLKKYKDNLGIDYESKPILAIKKSAIVKLKVDKKFTFDSKDEQGKTIKDEQGKTIKKELLISVNDDHYFCITGISKRKTDDTGFTIKSLKLNELNDKEMITKSFLIEFQFVSLDELGNEYASVEQKKIEDYLINEKQ